MNHLGLIYNKKENLKRQVQLASPENSIH